MLLQFALILVLVVLFYFLLIRPQQQRAKAHQAAVITAVKRGDDVVVLSSGVIGKVVRVEEAELGVEVAQGVTVKVVKSMIAECPQRAPRRRPPTTPRPPDRPETERLIQSCSYFARWKVVLCVLAILFGAVFSLPNAVPGLPGFLPQQKLNLGLDLQGGSYLLLEVDIASLKAEKLTNLVKEDVRTTLQRPQADRLLRTLARPAAWSASASPIPPRCRTPRFTAVAEAGAAGRPAGWSATCRRMVSGPDQTIRLTIPDQAMTKASADAVTQDIEIVRRRIDSLGTREPQHRASKGWTDDRRRGARRRAIRTS